jgi:hypothetical protein
MGILRQATTRWRWVSTREMAKCTHLRGFAVNDFFYKRIAQLLFSPHVQRWSFYFPHFALRGAARSSFTARIEGAHSDRAASASKKDCLAVPLHPSETARCTSTTLLRLF